MTPQQIAAQITELETKLSDLRDLQKAQRPALAAGQVWSHAEHGLSIVLRVSGGEASTFDVRDHEFDSEVAGFDDTWQFVGLARDVLRVVQPDAVEQVAPVQDEPTGAELVGEMCWVGGPGSWMDRVVEAMDGDRFVSYGPGGEEWYHVHAKLYREGVTP